MRPIGTEQVEREEERADMKGMEEMWNKRVEKGDKVRIKKTEPCEENEYIKKGEKVIHGKK
jgi:hypothetical protein